MKYLYLLFDADETLLDFKKAQKQAFFYALEQSGMPCDETLFRDFAEVNMELWRALERGELTRDELVATRFVRFCERNKLVYPKEGIMEAVFQDKLSQGVFLKPDALEICGRLSRHFRMFLITNGVAKIQRPRLRESGLDIFFEKIFVSEEVGAAKPSATYFEAVYKEMGGIPKSDVLVIGDSMTSDIAGGNGFGFDTCHIIWDDPMPEYDVCKPDYTIRSLQELLPILYGC